MPNYFNAFNGFECGRNHFDRLDVSYKKACMANPKEEYFSEILDHLNKHNHCHGKPLSSKNLREAVIRAMEEEEEGHLDSSSGFRINSEEQTLFIQSAIFVEVLIILQKNVSKGSDRKSKTLLHLVLRKIYKQNGHLENVLDEDLRIP